HVGELLGRRAEDHQLAPLPEIRDLVLAEDRLREAGIGHGDEGVELRGRLDALRPPARGHHLARAHVDAGGGGPRLLHLVDPLFDLLGHLPQMVLALLHGSYPPAGPAGAGSARPEAVASSAWLCSPSQRSSSCWRSRRRSSRLRPALAASSDSARSASRTPGHGSPVT